MYHVLTTSPPAPHTPAAVPLPAPRRPSGRFPPWPPARVWAAMNYVGQCQEALRPFCKEKSSTNGVLNSHEFENEPIERDLHPAQVRSFQAACDLLKSYFNGENWSAPAGYRGWGVQEEESCPDAADDPETEDRRSSIS